MLNQKETLKKHYTSIEKTGYTSRQLKLIKALVLLKEFYQDNEEQVKLWAKISSNNPKFKLKIYRLDLQRNLTYKLDITGTNTLNAWVSRLIGIGALSLNPTSEYIGETRRPNTNTKYFVNIERIDFLLEKIRATNKKIKGKISDSLTLDSFTKGEENHGNGKDHQETNKTNSTEQNSTLKII